MTAWMETATARVERVYADFLQQVVKDRVLKEREGPLSESMHKRLAKRTHIDPRVVRLMAISGKGGWHADPVRRDRYARNANVTLLDHLLSVVRGAMMLAALDWLASNPAMEEITLRRRLRAIAVLAFLHDLDKVLGLERDSQLPLHEVDAALGRYGLDAFLAAAGITLNAEQIRYLIEKIEASQAFRSPPAAPPPREMETLTGYVALADKLDGIWLSSDPEKGGLPGVLARLQEDQTVRNDVLRHWRTLELFDPHHPFLLDELQRWLALYSLRLAGAPPLIELHQDGRLFLLLPASEFETIVEKGIHALCTRLPFQLELVVSNRGVPALLNGQPGHEGLRAFVEELAWEQLSRLLMLKADLKDKVTAKLDELGLPPRWPRKDTGLISPFTVPENMDAGVEATLRRAGHLALLLNLKLPAAKKTGLPDVDAREQALLNCVAQERPQWTETIRDPFSRRVLTALWISAEAEVNSALEEAVWGTDGLLQQWLEGSEQHPGFSRFIEGRGPQVIAGVERHFQQLLAGRRVAVEDETATGRCLFTNQPIPFADTIDSAAGLYEVKISAFSGRDGRPETLTSERAHTNVSPVSIAEHKIRTQTHAIQGGKTEGVPSLISSPTTLGLFGGLCLTSDQRLGTLSIYDASRLEVKKGTVVKGNEPYRARYRLARFERMPEKTAGQVNQLGLLLKACRRLGRPIHVFRGLPTPQQAFFHYDAMPRVLVELLGDNSLRLEQIPAAQDRLETAQTLLETKGLGYDVLRLYATPKTRFAAVCLAWCHLHDALKSNAATHQVGIKHTLSKLNENYHSLLETPIMTTQDGPLVRLGHAAAGIQRSVGGKASANEEMLVFILCMEGANAARAAGQNDENSLICGIAGELETNLVRRDKAAASKHRGGDSLRDGCLKVAELFVREVWNGVLKNHPPSQRTRRILGSIYRMAFLLASRRPAETDDSSASAH